jgi:cell division protein FtsB
MDHAVENKPVPLADQMRDFFRRNLTWFLAIGLSLLLLQDVFGTHGLVAMRHSQQQAAATQKEIDQLNKENLQMQDRVKSLKSDPAAIERIAREEMGLARPGEYIFKIPSKSDDASNPASPSATPSQKP